ncbi:putative endonuclease 4 [Natranaerofaba carboxydovora]|nr:putative endonuclease 4 [Natranaerofaba carboxydovora]
MSLAGGYKKQLNNASKIGAETIQIFSGNPTSWQPPKLDKDIAKKFKEVQRSNSIWPLIFHTPYLINLASPKPDIFDKSVSLLKASLKRAELFDSPYVITHIGSHLGVGKEKGINNICKALLNLKKDWPEDTKLLLENTVGSGNNIGSTFVEIREIFNRVDNLVLDHLGFCFDTAHAFGAGYDLSTTEGVDRTIDELKDNIDLNMLKVIHANDTPEHKGSKKDRHEDLTKGNIGEDGFIYLLNKDEFSEVDSIILETPKRNENPDKENLDCLKKILGR